MTPPKNQAAQMLVITMFVELRPHRRMVHGTRPLILSRHGSQGLAQAIAAVISTSRQHSTMAVPNACAGQPYIFGYEIYERLRGWLYGVDVLE